MSEPTKKIKLNPLKTVRNDAGLWELINNADKQPLLLILTSEQYCAPCLELHPFLKPLAEKYADKMTVVKCNPDNIDDQSMEELGVDGVPTLLFVADDEVLDEYDGFSGDIDNVYEFIDHNFKVWEKEHSSTTH